MDVQVLPQLKILPEIASLFEIWGAHLKAQLMCKLGNDTLWFRLSIIYSAMCVSPWVYGNRNGPSNHHY